MGMEYKAGAEPHAALVRHESWLWLALLGSVSILAAGKSRASPQPATGSQRSVRKARARSWLHS